MTGEQLPGDERWCKSRIGHKLTGYTKYSCGKCYNCGFVDGQSGGRSVGFTAGRDAAARKASAMAGQATRLANAPDEGADRGTWRKVSQWLKLLSEKVKALEPK